MADLGVASRTDMKEHADMIANLDPSKMLIADMDTGYGGKLSVFRSSESLLLNKHVSQALLPLRRP